MQVIADLHLHSKYSQACSRDIDIKNLEKWARVKGLNLLGTSDFTHPEWIKELKRNLVNHDGIYQTATGFNFVLQTEISLIYSKANKGRRVHNILLAPDFEVVQQITDYLLKHGRIDYDGRPIFKIPCPDFVESLKEISQDIEVIPAHIWTPWFSMFGSESGFNTVKDCFEDQEKHIHAMETGLSSDPAMNWRLSQLDKYTLISNSDSHAFWPWRIGREANVFDIKTLTYKNLLNTLRTREGFKYTIEVDPNYGKYHIDGHRKCNFCSFPKQTKQLKGICPVCKQPLTIGVLNRVEELADRPEGFVPKEHVPFKSLLPLSEMISLSSGKAVASKGTWKTYNELVNGRTEFDVMLNMPKEEMLKIIDEKLADIIIKNRYGQVKVMPGYDGEYGIPDIGDKNQEKKKEMNEMPKVKNMQTSLNNFGL
jgi:uncharacterized protein (TIGR00375 family)